MYVCMYVCMYRKINHLYFQIGNLWHLYFILGYVSLQPIAGFAMLQVALTYTHSI